MSAVAFTSLYAVSGFTTVTYTGTKSIALESTFRLNGSVSKWNEEYQSGEDDDADEELITKEMFLRDGLEARRCVKTHVKFSKD